MARSTFWQDCIEELVVTSGGDGKIDLTGPLSVADVRGITLVRMIYKILFYPASPFDTNTIQGLHMGVAVVNNDALLVGGTALPNPGTSADAPGRGWVVRDQALCYSILNDNPHIGEMKGDIRAMRKFYQNTSLIMRFESDVEVGTPQSVNIFAMVRCLFKQQ